MFVDADCEGIAMDIPLISFSFDDARSDHYRVAKEILEPRMLPASFNVPTACVEGKIEVGLNGHISFEQLDYLVNSPLFEIAAHGDYHRNDIEDIVSGIDKLRAWYPGKLDSLGFVSPQSILDRKELEALRPVLEAKGIEYVRTGRAISRRNIPKRALSKLSKITKSTKQFVSLYDSSLNRNPGDYVLRGVSIMKQNTPDQVIALIDHAAHEKAWFIIELHSIDGPENEREYSEDWCWDRDYFIQVADYIVTMRDEGLVKPCTLIEGHGSAQDSKRLGDNESAH